MEENIKLVDGTTENVVEQPTEEVVVPEKTYVSDDEVNARVDELLAKKIGRKEAKIRREYENKYGELENIIKTGMKVDTLEDGIEALKDFYNKRGIPIQPQVTNSLSDRDEEYLAEKYADEIIDGSDYDEIKEEADMLASKGFDNMSKRDKIMFSKLNTYLTNESARKELASAGITDDILNDSDYKSFAENLNPNLSVKEKYDLYTKYRPKAKVEPIGTMRGTASQESGVKEYYTKEEALAFSKSDLDKNPDLVEAIEKSMLRW